MGGAPQADGAAGRAGAADAVVLKPVADFTWIQLPLSSMSVPEQEAYALLVALDDCVTDRFLRVRTLFRPFRESSAASLGSDEDVTDSADAGEALAALARLRIEHGFKGPQMMREFMRIVSKGVGDVLDLADLEKAVELVHKDRFRRKAQEEPRVAVSVGTSVAGSQDEAGADGHYEMASVHAAASRELLGAGFSLGQEARLDASVIRCELGDGSAVEIRMIFGAAAFTETLLFLSMRHMLNSDRAAKVTASDSMKAAWLISLLYCRFEDLRRKHDRRESVVRVDPPDPKTACPSFREKLQAHDDDAVSTLSASSVTSECVSNFFDTRARGAKYTSFRDKLLEEQPDLFEEFLEDVRVDGQDVEVCGVCGHSRRKGKLGRPFCYACSGVDDEVLCNSILNKVLERSRYRYEREVRSRKRQSKFHSGLRSEQFSGTW